MSRRDYETIAACLANAPKAATVEADRRSVASAIALELELDNPRFNRDAFLAAAGALDFSEVERDLRGDAD